jgi:hypothetical protein
MLSGDHRGTQMPKEQKTDQELEEIILQTTGIEVVVMPSPELGWSANAITGVRVGMEAVQTLLDASLPALRARYDLKAD